MKALPMFLGACALASIAGAVGGTTINTTPLQVASIGSDMIPDRAIAFDPSGNGGRHEALPDHYAMTTPEGRIEVTDLATRGLYAQQRYGWRTASYDEPVDRAFAQEEPADRQVNEPAALPNDRSDVAELPLDLSAPAAPEVTPRIIDVAAVLAVRD